jgi:hypothetical protein
MRHTIPTPEWIKKIRPFGPLGMSAEAHIPRRLGFARR